MKVRPFPWEERRKYLRISCCRWDGIFPVFRRQKQKEHEEHFKNVLSKFLRDFGFADYKINTSKRIDFWYLPGTLHYLDELNKLFFQVLAIKEKERDDAVNDKFGHIPYLISPLFDVSEIQE